eukprot:SAG31_NODE_4019_length_3661_cov_9.340820_3_plen_92_part_00
MGAVPAVPKSVYRLYSPPSFCGSSHLSNSDYSAENLLEHCDAVKFLFSGRRIELIDDFQIGCVGLIPQMPNDGLDYVFPVDLTINFKIHLA